MTYQGQIIDSIFILKILTALSDNLCIRLGFTANKISQLEGPLLLGLGSNPGDSTYGNIKFFHIYIT